MMLNLYRTVIGRQDSDIDLSRLLDGKREKTLFFTYYVTYHEIVSIPLKDLYTNVIYIYVRVRVRLRVRVCVFPGSFS